MEVVSLVWLEAFVCEVVCFALCAFLEVVCFAFAVTFLVVAAFLAVAFLVVTFLVVAGFLWLPVHCCRKPMRNLAKHTP